VSDSRKTITHESTTAGECGIEALSSDTAIPENDAGCERATESAGWTADASAFKPGDRVWPALGSMLLLQNVPQTVLATAHHPHFGEWLWLADDATGVRSSLAAGWTTEEPDDAEKARRAMARAQREEENNQLGWRLGFSPFLPVPADALPHSVSECTGFTACPAPLPGGLCGCE
jgi:hypothetical protein